ncbi:nitroreductase [Streptomyces sp. NPDC059698]|uniref:nitroreductase n=1 Tax=unclassified Streptomyces TaxID=2593676 RepID=UPI000B2DEF16
MPRTPDRTAAPAHEVRTESSDARVAPPPTGLPAPPAAARALLRRALADARSPRVPALSPYAPERPFPRSGPGLPWGEDDRRPEAGDASGNAPGPAAATPRTGADATIDLARWLRLSLAALPGTPGRTRPVPSAGALHPVRAHLLIGPGCSLPPGRYAYDPRAHRAHPCGPAPDGAPPGALLVLTVTASRTVAHYGHRAWPLLLLDAGHAAAALALAAPPTADALVSLDADGALLAAAAGLPGPLDRPDARPGAEPALPLAAVRLAPPGTSVTAPETLSAWAALPRAAAPAPHPGAATVPNRELATAQRLLCQLAEAPGLPAGTWHPAPRPAEVTDGALETRRSAPPDDLRRPPEKGPLTRILATARTTDPAGPDWTLAVGGDAPALYTAAPDGPGLHVRARGDARPTLAHWAAHQPWIGAAGAVLLAHGCPGDASCAEVRRSHLAAGHAIGAAQAHATALGLRSRPIGSWQQADLGAALGDPPGRDWIVHGLALGAPPATASAPPPSASRTAAPLPAAGRLTGAATPAASATATPPGEEERP